MFKVRIEPLIGQDAYGLWLVEYRDGRAGVQSYLAKPVQLEFEKMDQACFLRPKPTLLIGSYSNREIFRAIHEGMIEAGLAPDSGELKGKLEAQTKHLEDMQKAFTHLMKVTTNE